MSSRDWLPDAIPASPDKAAAAIASALALAPGVLVGELIALTEAGTTPLVVLPSATGPVVLRARTIVMLAAEHIGRSVVVVADSADAARPIVLGVLQSADAGQQLPAAVFELSNDGQRITLVARDRLELRCGAASITLTKAGKVIIDGTYVLSRSSGMHRIKGGSIQLN